MYVSIHIFIDKAVVHVIRLVSFITRNGLWFSVSLPSDGKG